MRLWEARKGLHIENPKGTRKGISVFRSKGKGKNGVGRERQEVKESRGERHPRVLRYSAKTARSVLILLFTETL